MADKHVQLKQAIIEVFGRMNRCFGYRRVHAQLRRDGWVVNHKLVYKLMDQLGLKSKVRAKWKYNSYKGTVSKIAKNVLDRRLTPDTSNMVWVSDIRGLVPAFQLVWAHYKHRWSAVNVKERQLL
ncbi:hypothetical protein FRC0036_00290 [Corynebacterium diphtheriae]|uniref:HTH-like domain-containing protein n=1 Tax=Corynebacterium diphtheriae TaxID=1717 RepID=A0A6J4WF03_CORDP|nr:hypothetical protein CIP100629_00172 [Corynebacterium diphtheriae]CAB0488790.1 hypothetical protein CIP100161_00161 [Corynebacterium diphtheriae]CAB0534400.1 hypothetical protein CIP107512_00203 [Corynebacterium diphtheriae]CAB0583251.1 hypothetical protein CIP107558_00218 [Corynebacterium diphtheriae]CAB0583299.1 hypothetical protein CIP107552_00372 [Corynebacterium diphtheriae]